jgi:hypothetical protein
MYVYIILEISNHYKIEIEKFMVYFSKTHIIY